MAGLIWSVCCPVIFYGLAIDFFSLFFGRQEPFLCTFAGALAVIPFLWQSYRRETEYEGRMDPTRLLWCAGAGISGCLAVNTVIRVSGIFQAYQETTGNVGMLWNTSPGLCVLAVGAVIPAAEELVFRGLVFGRLKKALGFGQAAWWSAALFAVYHGNVPQGVYGFVMGLLLSWVMEKERTLLAPTFLHAAANLTSVAVTAAGFLG